MLLPQYIYTFFEQKCIHPERRKAKPYNDTATNNGEDSSGKENENKDDEPSDENPSKKKRKVNKYIKMNRKSRKNSYVDNIKAHIKKKQIIDSPTAFYGEILVY